MTSETQASLLVSITRPRSLDDVIALVTNNFQSNHTRRAYELQLRKFRRYTVVNDDPFNKAAVQAYLQHLNHEGASTSSCNLALAAIKVLAKEAHIYGCLPKDARDYILEVKQLRQTGIKIGNWLDLTQVEQLYQSADASTLLGLRDKVLLGLLFFCALRREEASTLEWQHVRWINGRLILDGFKGKGNKFRPVPVHGALDHFLLAWRAVLGNPETGRVLRSIDRHGHIANHLNATGIWKIVRGYAERLQLDFAPHDLRRTFATLLEESGAPLARISDFLGHSDPKTTARYLSRASNLKHPLCDYVKLTQNETDSGTNPLYRDNSPPNRPATTAAQGASGKENRTAQHRGRQLPHRVSSRQTGVGLL